jgi:hypothetical protein
VIWLSIFGWIAAFALWFVGLILFHQTAKADFAPWKWTKRRLLLAGILGSAPIDVLALHLFPVPLAIVLSFLLTLLMTLGVVTVMPERWRRATRKNR